MFDKFIEKLITALKPMVKEAYKEGYQQCLTDIVQRAQFIYEVIAEKAKQDIYDQAGAIELDDILPPDLVAKLLKEDATE